MVFLFYHRNIMMMRAIMHALLSLSASKYAFKRTKHLLRVKNLSKELDLIAMAKHVMLMIDGILACSSIWSRLVYSGDFRPPRDHDGILDSIELMIMGCSLPEKKMVMAWFLAKFSIFPFLQQIKKHTAIFL